MFLATHHQKEKTKNSVVLPAPRAKITAKITTKKTRGKSMLEVAKGLVDQNKPIIDTFAGITIAASFWDFLPHFAIILSIVWICMRIYGTFLDNRKTKLEIHALERRKHQRKLETAGGHKYHNQYEKIDETQRDPDEQET